MGLNDMIVTTDRLCKSYKRTLVLDNLDLCVPKGSIFGFLGPNGAGKTTTMKILLGLIFPTSGSGKIFGRDIIEDSIYIRSRIGYLSQNPRFYSYMSARKNLEFVAGFFFKDSPKQLAKLINEMLDLVGLIDKADRPVKSFSGGELQRLGIAQAQINRPDLLILDEPTAALDPIGRKEVIDVMKKLKETTTIFYSTHILDDVQRVSDNVAILNRGKVVANGPIEDILKRNNKFAYEIIYEGTQKFYMELLKQSWVLDVTKEFEDGQWKLTVYVSDKKIADKQLFKMLQVEDDIVVRQYMHKQYQLEEAFMDIIGEVYSDGKDRVANA